MSSDTSLQLGIGIGLEDDIPSFSRRCEQLGFSFLSAGEHVVFNRETPNAFVVLAAAAAATEHIQLLSCATLLPLYPAALAAKMAAVLDVVSHGRFNMGVGIGGEFPLEFEACGVPLSQRGDRTTEAIQVVKRLFEDEVASFAGRYTNFEGLNLLPRPVQVGGPPIWVAGRSRAAQERAALLGDGWLPYMYSPDQLQESMATINALAVQHGRPHGSVRAGLFAFSFVHPDAAYARRVAAETVEGYYKQDFSTMVDKYMIVGNPEMCVDRLRAYHDAGADAVMLGLACPVEEKDDVLKRIAEDVMPALRSP